MTESRILTVANHLGSVGGTEIAQLAIFQALAKRHWSVSLLYQSRGDLWPAWSETADTAYEARSGLPSRSSPISSSIAVARATKIGISCKPSIVYVHNAGDVPIALAIGLVRKAPVVVHLHLPPPERQPKWLNTLIRRAHAVIAPSTDTANHWINDAALDPSKVSVIPTGIDVGRFIPLPAHERNQVREEVRIGSDELMILFVGRVERIKGVHFLLEAVSALPFTARVVVCGALSDLSYRDELLDACGAGLTPEFLGRRSDIPKLMAASDLVVVPSNWLETQGLVVGEAMACGVPVVASDVGGLSESMAGFPDQLVPPADSQALANAIQRVVNWRIDDPDLGDRSRSWVVEHISFDNTISAVDSLLSGLAKPTS